MGYLFDTYYIKGALTLKDPISIWLSYCPVIDLRSGVYSELLWHPSQGSDHQFNIFPSLM